MKLWCLHFFFPFLIILNLISSSVQSSWTFVTGFSEEIAYNPGVVPGVLSALTEDLNKSQGIGYFSVRTAFKGENEKQLAALLSSPKGCKDLLQLLQFEDSKLCIKEWGDKMEFEFCVFLFSFI